MKNYVAEILPHHDRVVFDGHYYTIGTIKAALSAYRREGDESTFRRLALGARFRYVNQPKTYVKIGPDTVAEWQQDQIDTGWNAQSICSACVPAGDDFHVELVG